MSSLISLINEAHLLEQAIIELDGEITPEIEEMIKINEQNLPTKVEQYAFLMKRMDALSSFYKERAEFFNRANKSCQSLNTSLKERMKNVLLAHDMKEVSGAETRFVISRTSGKLIIGDESQIPESYKTVKQSIDVNSEKLKADLKAGIKVPGASVEESYSLRMYPKT
jgi:hypothetical protein